MSITRQSRVWGGKVRYTGLMHVEYCVSCGVPFAFPEDFYEDLQEDKRAFYCPNGHGQEYIERESDRLRGQIQELERSVEWYQDALNNERRAHATTKSRADAGVCQHCGRAFQNVARHVKTKHPEAR